MSYPEIITEGMSSIEKMIVVDGVGGKSTSYQLPEDIANWIMSEFLNERDRIVFDHEGVNYIYNANNISSIICSDIVSGFKYDDKILNMLVTDLPFKLPARINNCLKYSGISLVVELIQLTEFDLLRIRNLGSRCIRDIVQALGKFNLTLKEEV